ncbi:MAG: diaminopimelate decarboxylase [Planctomycetota bacterium]|nr:MAG: diaminopimelate decarboxylase [Planctomycetota bacterium]
MRSTESDKQRIVPHGLLRELGAGPGLPLSLGGVPLSELAEEFGTPLYVYDAELLRQRLRRVRLAFGEQVQVLFALKANPNAAVASVLREAGAGVELASAGELALARAAGFAPSAMQFAGPAKGLNELRAAIELGLGCLNLESESEFEAIAALCAAAGQRARVAIRVNLREGAAVAGLRMSGGCSKFGVDEERVPALARRIEDCPNCELLGLHMYLGTQIHDAAAWLRGAEALLALAHRLEQELGRSLASLDFGGGFAVPTHAGMPEFALSDAGSGLCELLRGEAERRYFLELGRFLAAPAGLYLTRVVQTKSSAGQVFALVDGGMHHFAAAAGMGAGLRRPWPVVACSDPFAREAGSGQRIGGPLCTPQDEFVIEDVLPELKQGELLAFLAAGAYGASYSPLGFLSHPAPAEVLVDRGRSFLVRRAGTAEDALERQLLPEGLLS